MENFLSMLVESIKQRPYVPFLVIAGGLFTVSRCQNPIFMPLPSPHSTRLLELSADSGALSANVSKIDLEQEQHITYVALSYMWGSNERPECIRFGDHTVSIGINLHSALVRMRHNFPHSITGMRIWTDALCIDQRDNEISRREKEQQISIMSKIFSRAEYVVVDLGTMPEHFAAFESIMDTVMECVTVGALRLGRTSQLRDHEQTIFPHLQNHSALGDAMTVALQLVMKPYWQRIWMVQENAVAKRRRYLIGNLVVEGEIFDITVSCITRIFATGHCLKVNNFSLSWLKLVAQTSFLSLGPGSGESIALIDQTRLTYNDSDHHQLSMYDLLSCLMRQQASDPRDRIYGLLSMADVQSLPFDVPIDTSIPCRKLSLAVSKQFVQQGQLDALLALSGTVTGSNALPSWSLDLEDPRIPSSRFDSVYTWRSNFSANGSEEQDWANVVFDTTLQISGCMIDNVDQLCNRYPPSPTVWSTLNNMEYLMDIFLWLQRSQDWTKSMLLGVEDNSKLESYYNCLVAGLSHEANRNHGWPSDASKIHSFRADRELLMLICDWQAILEVFCTIIDDSLNEETEDGQDVPELDLSLSDTVAVIQEVARGNDKIGQLVDEFWTSPCITTRLLSPIQFGRLGVTCGQRLALFPPSVKAGDHVCILAGVSVPFVLRRSGEAYQVVGHCYVHGLMDGEVSKTGQNFTKIELI